MQLFREITESAARKIDRRMMGMADVGTLEELEVRFLEEAEVILPGDCLCWNNWTLNLENLINFRINLPYVVPFEKLLGVFAEVVPYHPVIASNRLGETSDYVMRLSDFESRRQFRENPLFREVYRHLDSHYQLAYTPCLLGDRRIVLTWNRRALDFTERDRQVFQFMGTRLARISRWVQQRQKLENNWLTLSGFVDARISSGSVASLGTKDTLLLSELLKSGTRSGIALKLGIRRDSVDKRLGAIRERLGLENHHQLLTALAELKPRWESSSLGPAQ